MIFASLYGARSTRVLSKNQQSQKYWREFRQFQSAVMDIQQYIESGRNLNTKKKTEQSIGLFKEYLNRQFILLAPEDQDHIDLNVNLCRFLITLKRKNGSEYEPVTVRSIVGGIARYLTEKKYANIMEHPDFKDMHAVLKRKMKELKDKGMGNGPRTASALTNEEVKSMWESGVFTLTTPLGLLRILFFYMSMNFGMRSGQEHRDLQWGDISLQRDHNDDEFLTYTERRTKTRSGENPKDRRKCVPQLWAQPHLEDKDPVAVYKKYAEKRPEAAKDEGSPFYLSVIYRKDYTGTAPWYKATPVGRNTLQTMMSKSASEAGISGKNITNHSARKTMIQTLRNSGFNTESIMEKSGHKNVSSVLNYSVVTDEEQKRMTSALMGEKAPQPAPSHTLPPPPCSSGSTGPMFAQHWMPPPPTVTYNNCTIISQPQLLPWTPAPAGAGDVLKDLFRPVVVDSEVE